MSSRVLLPDDLRGAAQIVWREVSTEPAKPVPEQKEDFTAKLIEMQHQWEQRVREAHAAGRREGEAAGRTQAAAELRPVLERLALTIDEIANLRAHLRKEAESDMVKLSLAIARRVVRRELAVDPEALHGLVLAALEKLQSQEGCRVRVHPSHVAAVTDCLRKSQTGSDIQVTGDPSREPGTVIFETERGNLDASVESQLQEIERGLTDRLQRHQ